MADHAAGEDIFVYTGGRAPQHVVNAIIDESVDKIDDDAFRGNPNLKSVVCHDGVLKVGKVAFYNCSSLQRIKMPGVKIIEQSAFYRCTSLTHVEFGDKLETVGDRALMDCKSLKWIKLPIVMTIGKGAFANSGIEELELGEELETIGSGAFRGSKLRRIAIPLKDGIFQLNTIYEAYTQFLLCSNLTTVDLAGGIHKTVASLHLESWRDEMNEEIQRINQLLFNDYPNEKASMTVQWIQSVIGKIDHYKAEHRVLLKEATALLELALWKAKLDCENDADSEEESATKKMKMDPDSAKKAARVTCGADIVIKNILPFLKLA
jgi:hypothetical protein